MDAVWSLTSALLAQAKASQQQGTLVHRELHKQAYNDALVQRYQHLPDVKRIQRHRHLPTPLYKVRWAACFHILNVFRFVGHRSRLSAHSTERDVWSHTVVS